jgi:ankyrin repeat protein
MSIFGIFTISENLLKYLNSNDKYNLVSMKIINYINFQKHLDVVNKAIDLYDFEMVERAINSGVNCNKLNKSLIYNVVSSNNIYMLNFLISKKFDIVSKNPGLIILTIQNNCMEILKILLENGLKINTEKEFFKHKFPIQFAVDFNNLEATKLLIKYGANVNDCFSIFGEISTPIISATKNNNIEMLRLLIDNKCKMINSDDGNFKTSLHYAIQNNNLEIIKYLIKNGIDVNKYAPICFATKLNNLDAIKILISSGAKLKAPLYECPLFIAKKNNP